MAWAKEFDCIEQFGSFLILEGAATSETLEIIRKESKKKVRQFQKEAWAEFRSPIDTELKELTECIAAVQGSDSKTLQELQNLIYAGRADLHAAARKVLHDTAGTKTADRAVLQKWSADYAAANAIRYNAHLMSEGLDSALAVEPVAIELLP